MLKSIYFRPVDRQRRFGSEILYACSFVYCNPWKGKWRTMYGMFFHVLCFCVVLSYLVFVPKPLKT